MIQFLDNSSPAMSQFVVENNMDISEELVLDIFKTSDVIMSINYNILQIVGSETKENQRASYLKGIDRLIIGSFPLFILPIAPLAGPLVAIYKASKLITEK